MSACYEILFERGEGDSRWIIERDGEGELYCSSNAETRQLVSPQRHAGLRADDVASDLRRYGVPDWLVDLYLWKCGF